MGNKSREIVVVVQGASGLRDNDNGFCGDVSDPYVVVCLNGRPELKLAKTRVVQDNTNPKWNETFTLSKHQIFRHGTKPECLSFFIYDCGDFKDESLGYVNIPFGDIKNPSSPVNGNFSVQGGCGNLRLTVCTRSEVAIACSQAVDEGKADSNPLANFASSNTAKYAGGAALGVAVAGIAAVAINKRRENKRRKRTKFSSHSSGWCGYGSSDEEGFGEWWDHDSCGGSSSDSEEWGGFLDFDGEDSSSSSDGGVGFDMDFLDDWCGSDSD